MSADNGWQRQAVLAVMGSLMAYNFYGRIEDAANIQSMKQEIVQLKSETRDIWTKYNADIKEKTDMMMKMADYMISNEQRFGEVDQRISEVELNNIKRWLDSQ